MEYMRESQFEDVSFLIEENQIPLLGLRMAVRTYPDGKHDISGFGRPISYCESGLTDAGRREGAIGLLREEMDRLSEATGCTSIFFEELGSTLSPLGRYLMDRGAKAIPYFAQVIDLTQSEASLRQQLRKSYKSLINWGHKNLDLQLLDHRNITPADMGRLRQLHTEAAGRETRSPKTWDLQLEMVRSQEAFLILGVLDGTLVTGAIFCQSPKYCYYGVSASKRELFDKPLGHSVLWMAVLHAKKNGCRLFETGELFYPNQGSQMPTSKELAISTFKKGFGGESRLRLRITWERQLNPSK